jgi:S1-C subfamily serine protease
LRPVSPSLKILGCLTAASLAVLLPAGRAAGAADRSAEGAIVVLATHDAHQGIGAGTVVAKSGTLVRVLTAAHVATYGSLQVRLDDGVKVPAHLVAILPGRDLALIDAELDADDAASLRVAPLANPRAEQAVHVWGSGNDGPAYETAVVESVGRAMPDGPPHGRYALGCKLCHQGDSGAGVFDGRGELVGVYIGYFEMASGRLSVAEAPESDLRISAVPLSDGAGHAQAAASSLALAAGDPSSR